MDEPMSLPMRISLGTLTVLYFVLSLACAAQLIRIRLRSPSLKWTSQKSFLILTFFIGALRTALFILAQFFYLDMGAPAFTILADLASLLYFSSYTVLILFWAQIIIQAKQKPLHVIRRMRVTFIAINIVIYLLQICIWVLYFTLGQETQMKPALAKADNAFYGTICLASAAGFLVFGGRLFHMIRSFPVESSAKGAKLREVGWVTVICTLCFTLRAVMTFLSGFHTEIVKSWIFVFVYYLLTEVIPSLLVFFILRTIPPKSPNGPSTQRLLSDSSQQNAYSDDNDQERHLPPRGDSRTSEKSIASMSDYSALGA